MLPWQKYPTCPARTGYLEEGVPPHLGPRNAVELFLLKEPVDQILRRAGHPCALQEGMEKEMAKWEILFKKCVFLDEIGRDKHQMKGTSMACCQLELTMIQTPPKTPGPLCG